MNPQGESAQAIAPHSTALGGIATSTPTATGPPLKFSYNTLHYPQYPKYDALLKKRFNLDYVDSPQLNNHHDNEEALDLDMNTSTPVTKKRTFPGDEKELEFEENSEQHEKEEASVHKDRKKRRKTDEEELHVGAAALLPPPPVAGDGVEPEERPEEEEVEMSEAKFLKKSQFDLDIDFEKEKQIMKEELRDNVAVLGRLLKPLEGLRRYTLDVGDCLKGMKYNLDFAKLVQVIDRDLNDLNEQILARKNFYLFVMELDRPVHTHLGYFGVLPPELLHCVFQYLDGKELLVVAQVCTTFNTLSNDEHLWKGIVERTWDKETIEMQKPSHKTWKWLFECKRHTFRPEAVKNGRGSCVGEHGDVYEGEWKEGKRHGIGTAMMQDGRRYDGEWENDMRSGFGIFRWPINYAKNGGDLYAGNWKQDQRHGNGIYIWADGTTYEGQWKEGKREGHGSVVWPDGRRYDGDYKDGKMSGKGTFRWPDGSVYVGEYKDGKRHGEGTYTYSTMMGGVYIGQWRNGMRDGWGKLVKNDGEMYQGVWKFNCPFGGVLTKKDGTVIEKFWRLFPTGNNP